jgi:hypothetical protein
MRDLDAESKVLRRSQDFFGNRECLKKYLEIMTPKMVRYAPEHM